MLTWNPSDSDKQPSRSSQQPDPLACSHRPQVWARWTLSSLMWHSIWCNSLSPCYNVTTLSRVYKYLMVTSLLSSPLASPSILWPLGTGKVQPRPSQHRTPWWTEVTTIRSYEDILWTRLSKICAVFINKMLSWKHAQWILFKQSCGASSTWDWFHLIILQTLSNLCQFNPKRAEHNLIPLSLQTRTQSKKLIFIVTQCKTTCQNNHVSAELEYFRHCETEM